MVYVDPLIDWVPNDVWRWDHVSHMYADTADELHKLAKKIGLKREWCSDKTQPGSLLLHYDLNKGRRAAAIKHGAIEVDHGHGRTYYRSREVRKREIEDSRLIQLDLFGES